MGPAVGPPGPRPKWALASGQRDSVCTRRPQSPPSGSDSPRLPGEPLRGPEPYFTCSQTATLVPAPFPVRSQRLWAGPRARSPFFWLFTAFYSQLSRLRWGPFDNNGQSQCPWLTVVPRDAPPPSHPAQEDWRHLRCFRGSGQRCRPCGLWLLRLRGGGGISLCSPPLTAATPTALAQSAPKTTVFCCV